MNVGSGLFCGMYCGLILAALFLQTVYAACTGI